MGYFDGLTDGLFKKDTLGDILFYPWGILGSGFIIKSEPKHNQIRRFIKTISIIILFSVTITLISLIYWLNYWPYFILFWLGALLIFTGWYYVAVKKITRDLPRASGRLTITESLKNSAKSHNLPILILLELFSIGFIALGIWLFLYKEQNLIFPLFPIIFFGLCAIAIGYMIFAKLQK